MSVHFQSWIALLYFDLLLHLHGLPRVHEVVRSQQVCYFKKGCRPSAAELCNAIDLVCVFHYKQVLCLQRSAVATVVLRRHGWQAEMVIGAQVRPFKSHAWVEIEGVVVNDKSYMPEIYHELERC